MDGSLEEVFLTLTREAEEGAPPAPDTRIRPAPDARTQPAQTEGPR